MQLSKYFEVFLGLVLYAQPLSSELLLLPIVFQQLGSSGIIVDWLYDPRSPGNMRW